jgi:hypothetical protein
MLRNAKVYKPTPILKLEGLNVLSDAGGCLDEEG